MSKVTSKHEVATPKALAARAGIRVGDELEWEHAAGALRVRLAGPDAARISVAERLRLFDAATARQAARQRGRLLPRSIHRGWTREDLYRR